jgi:hypothetical protein
MSDVILTVHQNNKFKKLQLRFHIEDTKQTTPWWNFTSSPTLTLPKKVDMLKNIELSIRFKSQTSSRYPSLYKYHFCNVPLIVSTSLLAKNEINIDIQETYIVFVNKVGFVYSERIITDRELYAKKPKKSKCIVA